MLGRAVSSVTALAVAAAGLLAATPAQAAPARATTPFAYMGSAYGTQVSVGDPQQGGLASGRTAWSTLACTTMAPITHDKGSFVGKVNANEFVQVEAVSSTTSSYRRPAVEVFGSRSVNRVTGVILGEEGGPQLSIGGVTTVAHAFHQNGRFRADTAVSLSDFGMTAFPEGATGPLGDLVDAIEAGRDQVAAGIIEAAGSEGITIPGLGTVYPAGKERSVVRTRNSVASAFALRVELDNGSTINIGRAWAKIERATPAGVFGGNAYALEASVADGALGIGRTPYQPLPCSGTDGEWLVNVLARVPNNPELDAGVLRAATFGRAFPDGRGIARSRSSLGSVEVGALELRDVVGQVNVGQRANGRIGLRNINGTRVGAILANGKLYEVPPPGESLTIPGVAVIEVGVRRLIGKRGIMVHALRVTLRDGSGLVLNVGTAKARISR